MRRKKHKHTRRAVRFYRINFGFRPPYKVLLDGNFVSAVESLKRGDCKELVTKLLGDPARLFTTKCVMQELRSLGKQFDETRQTCKRYALHKCEHEDGTTAAQCLTSQIEGGNPEHFFVATQDRSIQREVMAVPGGACIFASVNGVHLETPSEMQKSHVQKKEAAHMAPGVVEARSASLRELTEAEIQDKAGATGPRIQRKKAKGPNPLASKPKKPKHAQQQTQPAAGGSGAVSGEGEEGGGKKRKRRRRTSGDGSGE